MKYWQIEGGTATELANERRHNEQKQKQNTGVHGRGTEIQTVYETPCVQKGPPVSAAC